MKTLSTLTLLLISTICSAEINFSSWQGLNTNLNGAVAQKKSPVLAVKTQSNHSTYNFSRRQDEDLIVIKMDNAKDTDTDGAKFVKRTLGMAGFGGAIGTFAFIFSDHSWKVKPLLRYAGYGALVGLVLGASCSAMALGK